MAQQLRALTVPPEDLGLIPSTYMEAHNSLLTPFPEASAHTGHLHGTQLYMLVNILFIHTEFLKCFLCFLLKANTEFL